VLEFGLLPWLVGWMRIADYLLCILRIRALVSQNILQLFIKSCDKSFLELLGWVGLGIEGTFKG
jgi:hypothetical protein